MEKVFKEVKIIETEDGFRIEIKGDKEAIRGMLHNCESWSTFWQGFHFDFGPDFWSDFGKWCGCWQEAGSKKYSA
jgi:hypothetical protein